MTTRSPRARRERGAALLLVLMVVAVVTVLATELAYDTRVSLQIAANARDELRASYQARGAVALSRLVLHFQQRLDQAGGRRGPAPGRDPGGAGRRGASRRAASQGTFSFRLWDAIPVDDTAIGMLLGTAPRAAAGTKADESFQATIEDEERKVNVSQLAGLSTVAGPQLQRFLLAVRDPQVRRALRQGGRAREPAHAPGRGRGASRLGGRGRHHQRAWASIPCPPSRRASATRTSTTTAGRTGTGPRTPGSTRSTSSTWWPGSATPSWARSGIS